MLIRLCFVFFIFSMFLNIGFSQNSLDCENKMTATITAESGLKLRERPSIDYPNLITIPYKKLIYICQNSIYRDTIDSNQGFWFDAVYDGKKGYVFSAYIDVQKCSGDGINIIVPNDKSVDNFPLLVNCSSYQGLYATDKNANTGFQDFHVAPIELVDTTLKYGHSYVAKMKSMERMPLLIIGGINIQSSSLQGNYLNKKFFPFQQEHLWYTNNYKNEGIRLDCMAYAKGEGEFMSHQDEFNIGPFQQIKNYELWIRVVEKGKEPIDIQLYKADIGQWAGGYAGGGEIIWVGDLNGDGIPEILTRTSMTYKGWDYHLLLSNPKATNGFYDILIVGGGSPC